jgi:hypothetical protein
MVIDVWKFRNFLFVSSFWHNILLGRPCLHIKIWLSNSLLYHKIWRYVKKGVLYDNLNFKKGTEMPIYQGGEYVRIVFSGYFMRNTEEFGIFKIGSVHVVIVKINHHLVYLCWRVYDTWSHLLWNVDRIAETMGLIQEGVLVTNWIIWNLRTLSWAGPGSE